MTTCYRHPGRETNVSCSNCGNPICPECMTPSPVGMRCPDCSQERQTVIRARDAVQRTAFQIAPVTVTLIAINALVFLAELLTGGAGVGGGDFKGSVLENGAFWAPGIAAGDYWRIITAGFLHAGLFHIAMNMLLLWFLGSLLEPAIGGLRFAVIYFTSLIAGSLGAMLLEPNAAAVGASGAVFGLMGAALVAFYSRGLNPFESGIGGLLVLNLVITFAVPGISKGGHLGGVVGGLLAGAIVFLLDEKLGAFGRARWLAPVICAAVGVACFFATIYLARQEFPPELTGL